MASLAWGLCLVLTLWMAGSRSSAGIRTGPPGSSLWWDQGSRDLQNQAFRYRAGGDFGSAERLYQHGYEEAQRRGDRLAEVRFLISVGGCRLGRFEYRAALASFLKARDLADSIGDRADLGSIGVNLSSVYLQVWELQAAFRSAEDGLAAIRDLPGNYARPYLLLQLGRLHSVAGDGGVGSYFEDAIEAARAAANVPLEAQAWDLLGEQRLAQLDSNDGDGNGGLGARSHDGNFEAAGMGAPKAHAEPGDERASSASSQDAEIAEAERDFGESFRLRRFFDPAELGFSYGWLGAVDLARGEFSAAARFTSAALAAAHRGAPSLPEYLLRHQEGRIRLAQSDTPGALADFQSALDAAERWRLEVLPARSSLTAANIALDRQVFRSFIELAARESMRMGDAALAERAFEAVEINRAASLRESLALAEVWRAKLPSEYWEYRAKLGAVEARADTVGAQSEAAGLALRLTEMEAQAGLGFSRKKGENFSPQTSLIHYREGLRDDELVLSFSLGKTESYLWAVGRDSVRMLRLPDEVEIGTRVRAFRDAVQRTGGDRPEAVDRQAIRLGAELYRLLFGQLGEREKGKKAWLLSLEGVLFDVPFAALVAEAGSGSAVYLVERHSLEAVPGALLPSMSAGSDQGGGEQRFLGVGDPIYNVADPRWRGPRWTGEIGAHLQRLAGSGAEIAASSRSWRESAGPATILTGARATRSEFLNQLGQHPLAIHLATHVLAPGDHRQRGLIAFGLAPASSAGIFSSPGASPEYLTTSEITALDVAGALVVMSGCDTGMGDAKAGAGLLGLTRAWLMAGAQAVITTAWPVEDSSGEIFASFYGQWRPGSIRRREAARALRASQVEMIHSGTWRAAPSYWAAFQITEGWGR